ncbi:hypothetical protein GF312_11670 [Candidatus Poribacteria bacterium]|nr:hypothetical protein [Candidatus Poribacteria bacterium]
MITGKDREKLRDLAKRVADIADMPIMEERKNLWKKHNSLKTSRPMILIFPEGSWGELLPRDQMECESDQARGMEWSLRSRIYYYEHFQDDTVIEKEWIVSKAIGRTGWGMSAKHIPSTEPRGAWHFDPVIKEPSDLKKLKFPEVTHDEEASKRNLEQMQDLFGDILDVKQKGVSHISFHLMNIYTGLRGLEEVMCDMYENPGMLHDAMSFLEEGHRRMLDQYVDMNLLSLNNDNTYQNTGGNGYTDELPPPDYDPERIRLCDMWGSAEAQELAQVSPEMHVEFSMQYEKRLLEPFALTGYGCCEDLTLKLDDVFTIPQIRRISVAPSADVDASAEKLKGNYIYSWKPQPSHLVGEFNTDVIKKYIKHTVDVALENNCILEMVLKDTHTCEHKPERFDIWSQIAREAVNEAM